MTKPIVTALLAASFAWAAPVEQKDVAASLTRIQRVYVEPLEGSESSGRMRDILISALQNSGLFAMTENAERADAVIRGSSDDETFTDEHHSSETLGLHNQTGSGQSAKNSKTYMGAGLTDNEASTSRERKHEASASVRLVAANGDVIWSTTQESSGARFRGAMADVADKIVHKLSDDVERARKTESSSPVRSLKTESAGKN